MVSLALKVKHIGTHGLAVLSGKIVTSLSIVYIIVHIANMGGGGLTLAVSNALAGSVGTLLFIQVSRPAFAVSPGIAPARTVDEAMTIILPAGIAATEEAAA